MRLTASGVFTRPAPVPKMPNGLVELMEGLTRDVLKNNPSNIYEFCANHMQELILIRDGSAPNPLTIDQKIKRAQEKIRQRADERRRKYDETTKKCGVVLPQACGSTQDVEISDSLKEPFTSVKDQRDAFYLMENKDNSEIKIKTPIHHEKDIADALEVEIFHKIKVEGDKSKNLLTENTETAQTDISNIDKTDICYENPVLESKTLDVPLSENDSGDLDSVKSIEDDNKSSTMDGKVEIIDDDKAQIIEKKLITFSAGMAENLNSVDTIEEITKDNTTLEHLKHTEEDSDNKSTDFIDKNKLMTFNENDYGKDTLNEHSLKNSENDQPAPIETLRQDKVFYQDNIEENVHNDINLKKEEAEANLNSNTNSVTQQTTDQITSFDDAKENPVVEDFLTSDTSVENAISTKNNISDESSTSIPDKIESVSFDANSKLGDDLNISVTKTLEDNIEEKNVIPDSDNNAIDTSNSVENAVTISNTSIYYVDKTKSNLHDEILNTEDPVLMSDQTNVQPQINTDNDAIELSFKDNFPKSPRSVETSEKPGVVSANSLSEESLQATNPVLKESFEHSNIEKNQLEIRSLLESEPEGKESNGNIVGRDFNVGVLTTVDKEKINDNESIPNKMNEKQDINVQLFDTKENNETENENNVHKPELENGSESLELDLDKRDMDYNSIERGMSDLSRTKTICNIAVTESFDTVPKNENVDSMEHMVIVDSVLEIDDHRSSTDLSEIKSNSNSMDLETAAITIQKVFRSFLFKKGSTFDETNIDNSSIDDDSKAEVDFLKSTPPVLNKERRTLGLSRMDTVLQTVNEEKSLSLSTDDSSLSSAATIIQAHVRGFLVRNRLNSNKTNSTSLVNSEGQSTSLEGEGDQKANKTVLNIHIVPEGERFLSRDESLLTSIELSLDGSPPSSSNLHPLGYDKSEPRKQLKREDAIQSVSPPSNNSGKLSEDVDSVKDMVVLDSEQQKNNESIVSQARQETDLDSRDDTPTRSTTVETVIEAHKIVSDGSSSPEIEQNNAYAKSLLAIGTDEHDVVTPSEDRKSISSNDTLRLLHSGEFHDVVLPTKISRTDTTIVRGE